MSDRDSRTETVEALRRVIAAEPMTMGYHKRLAEALLDGPVAALLAQARREGAAEALTEAAEDVLYNSDFDYPWPGYYELLERAAAYRAGDAQRFGRSW